jgi:hypothetical protein
VYNKLPSYTFDQAINLIVQAHRQTNAFNKDPGSTIAEYFETPTSSVPPSPSPVILRATTMTRPTGSTTEMARSQAPPELLDTTEDNHSLSEDDTGHYDESYPPPEDVLIAQVTPSGSKRVDFHESTFNYGSFGNYRNQNRPLSSGTRQNNPPPSGTEQTSLPPSETEQTNQPPSGTRKSSKSSTRTGQSGPTPSGSKNKGTTSGQRKSNKSSSSKSGTPLPQSQPEKKKSDKKKRSRRSSSYYDSSSSSSSSESEHNSSDGNESENDPFDENNATSQSQLDLF